MQSIPVEEAEVLKKLVGPRYQLQSLLGNNPGRKTLLAIDNETDEKVVLKLLLFGKEFAWQDLKLFEREAETLRSLEHSAIPQYLDYFDVESTAVKGFALVQSYIEARSLATQVAAGRCFSEEDLEQIAQQLLEILEYLHSRQPAVIHRDIKPSNILLTDRTAHSVGQVYLVDFGSVQTLAAREGGTITVVGTYGYMPPEQFGGRAVPASDLYSLGATLIYLASGKHPADLPQDELRLEFEEVVQLSPRMVSWLQKLIQPGLGKRFSSSTTALQVYFSNEAEEQSARSFTQALSQTGPFDFVSFQTRPHTINAALEEHKLLIKFPGRKLKIRDINQINAWQSLLVGCGGCSVLFVLLLVMIGVSANINGVSFWGLSLGACIFLSLIFMYIEYLSSLATILVTLTDSSILLQQSKHGGSTFSWSEVWEIKPFKNEHCLCISMGSKKIYLYGSQEERDWVQQVFEKAWKQYSVRR